MKSITVIGSGLAGTLVAIYLAQRDYAVDLFETRSDQPEGRANQGRSINLAMSCRGLTSLASVGLEPAVRKLMVPMRARAIHEKNGEVHYQPFGRHWDEYINAILRTELNDLLRQVAKKYPNIQWHFDTKLVDIDFDKNILHFTTSKEETFTRSFKRLIGADGANSKVRDVLKNKGLIAFSRQFLPYGYKELSISQSHQGSLVREHLHLWPRDSFLLLGNPNVDDSITGTLFLPQEGKASFDTLTNKKAVNAFFKEMFPDVFPAMPHLAEEFFDHPMGNMSNIKCSQWHYDDRCLLIGDAAHGVVPFFGQGMNSAFEDCRVLNALLDEYQDDWKKVMPVFFDRRKPNTDAVIEMSMDNYYEIQRGIRDDQFNLKKHVEHEIMRRYPHRYVSKHVQVMFTNTPYAVALAQGKIQQDFLHYVCDGAQSMDDINWKRVEQALDEYDKKLSNV